MTDFLQRLALRKVC